MELSRLLLGRAVPLALLRLHMDHHGPLLLLCPLEHITKALEIMAVDGAKIGKAHILKEGRPGEEISLQRGLQPVVEAVEGIFLGLGTKEPPVPLFEVVVGGLGPKLGQMRGHGPHIGVDGHAVVIQNNDEGLSGGPGVVESLVCKAAGQGAITNEGQNAVILLLQSSGPGHAQGNRHRVGGVTGNKSVVDALVGLGEAGKSIQLTEGIKQLLPPRQGLMDIALVAHIKDQSVLFRVKDPVDGHRQLHGPQIGGQVASGFRNMLDQKFPQLPAKKGQLVFFQRLYVGWGMNHL